MRSSCRPSSSPTSTRCRTPRISPKGYRTLKLGKVVGEPTAGWIIYTGGITLIDGSVLRMPGTKIFASDGTPMEMHPRPVDVAVTRPVGESYTGKDIQLDTAVAELLQADRDGRYEDKFEVRAASSMPEAGPRFRLQTSDFDDIIRSAIANSRNPTAPRQNPTGSSRKTRWKTP